MKRFVRAFADLLWTLDALLAVLAYTAILLLAPMPKWPRKT